MRRDGGHLVEYPTVTIHLIRHEKTQANLEYKYLGWTDEPIVTSPALLTDLQPSQVYGSDLIRCQQTAECYFPHASFIASDLLREINFGQYELKTYAQLKDIQAYRDWIDDPYNVNLPNGESFQAFQKRVLQGFKKTIETPGEYVFVVHGGVIRTMLSIYGPTVQSFQQVHAQHRTQYTLHWAQFLQWEEGQRCTSYSEAPLTVKDNL